MTLGHIMTEQFSLIQYGEFILRILFACLCGAAIGFERSMRFKEAGIRTHMIVCCAAALMMIVSKYGFADLTDAAGQNFPGIRGADSARIAAQVVSGISFLGAGIIFRNGTSIRGLTTAAGIWATAGIGLAIGAGLYILGFFCSIIIAVLQIIMHKYSLSYDAFIIGRVHCTVEHHSAMFRKAMNDFIEKNNMKIISSKISAKEDGMTTYDMTLRLSQNIAMHELTDFLESIDGVSEISCELGM